MIDKFKCCGGQRWPKKTRQKNPPKTPQKKPLKKTHQKRVFLVFFGFFFKIDAEMYFFQFLQFSKCPYYHLLCPLYPDVT